MYGALKMSGIMHAWWGDAPGTSLCQIFEIDSAAAHRCGVRGGPHLRYRISVITVDATRFPSFCVQSFRC